MSEINVDCCSICLDKIDENKRHTLVCSHIFHVDCIIESFRRGDSKCPMCRDDPYETLDTDEDENYYQNYQRGRIRNLRERQGIAQRIPEVKKLQLKFREYKKEYQQTQQLVYKQERKFRKEQKLYNKRSKMRKSHRKYLDACIANRKNNPGERFLNISPHAFNT